MDKNKGKTNKAKTNKGNNNKGKTNDKNITKINAESIISAIKYSQKERIKIINVGDIHRILKTILEGESKIEQNLEHFWIMGLTDDNWLLSVNTVVLGNSNSVATHPLASFRYVRNQNANYAIIAHSNPKMADEIINPTEEYIDLTDRFYHFGKMVHIPLKDSLIVTLNNYYSFEEHTLMQECERNLKHSLPYIITDEAIAEGEEKRSREIVLEMLADNVDIDIISIYTELNSEQIKKIEHNKKVEFAQHLLFEKKSIKEIAKETNLTKTEIENIQIETVKHLLIISPDEIDEIVDVSGFTKKKVLKIKHELLRPKGLSSCRRLKGTRAV